MTQNNTLPSRVASVSADYLQKALETVQTLVVSVELRHVERMTFKLSFVATATKKNIAFEDSTREQYWFFGFER